MNKYPYLKIILTKNKNDQESIRQISNFEIKEYLDNNKSIDSIDISTKDGENIQELINKINKALNETKNDLPINLVSESQMKVKRLMNTVVGSLSLILIGDSGVGKTCFFDRYFKNKFQRTIVNIGVDKEIKFIKIGNEKYKLTVWDTAGAERFRALPKKYYQNADGALLLFDVTQEDSFYNVSEWIKDVNENSNRENDVVIYILGNKIDKPERVVTKEKAEEFANSLGLKYYEISCKINMNIQEIMARMIIDCYKKINNIKGSEDGFQLQRDKKGENQNKKKCCH